MVKVEWSARAVEDLSKLDKPIAQRIIRKVAWFADNFDQITPEALSRDLKGLFKLRIGDWRIIYQLNGDTALICYVGHRKDIYDIK